jgi:hypothetical protein
MHQGWPKLAAHLWMRTPDKGIAAVVYAPAEVRFSAGDVPVTVTCDTDYPFRETATLTVAPERPAAFPVLLRVPAWARGATVSVDGAAPESMEPGTYHRLDREWAGTTSVRLRLPMRPEVQTRYHGAVAVTRGPLVYSLSPEEEWTRVNADKPHRELPHGDFEVRPASSWNYGLILDPADPEAGLTFEERPVGNTPFSPDGAGMSVRVRGRRLPDWGLRHGWADEIASGPHASGEPVEDLTLIPYGCTNIRVTEFPRLTE